MSSGYGDKEPWTLFVFSIGILFCIAGLVLTIASIWLMGHHGLSPKLGGTAAVSYVVGAICTLVGGFNRWDWS